MLGRFLPAFQFGPILLVLVMGNALAEETRFRVGMNVLQRSPDVVLRKGAMLIPLKKLAFYKVEKVDGDNVWLLCDGTTGQASTSDFVPADQAIAYFTERINADRAATFSY